MILQEVFWLLHVFVISIVSPRDSFVLLNQLM